MNVIRECKDKLVPVMEAAIGLVGQVNPHLPVKDIVSDLELALSWLETAYREYDKVTASSGVAVVENGQPQQINLRAPTLISIPERFDYIYKSLEVVSGEFYNFKEEQGFPPRVKEHLDNTYRKIVEAWFNTRRSEIYYGSLTR